MASSNSEYKGADYGFFKDYGEGIASMRYRPSAGEFGFPSNPQTANQVQAVSQKLNTGAKVVEVSGVSLGGSSQMDNLDNMPKQQFKEINRLKQLAGVELTFHGPLVDPVGLSREGLSETERQQAERQMFSAVQRGHELDPKGNLVITFHSTNALPELQTLIKEGDKVEKKSMLIVNERTGQIQQISKPRHDYFENMGDKSKAVDVDKHLNNINKQQWQQELEGIGFSIDRAQRELQIAQTFNQAIPQDADESTVNVVKNTNLMNVYADSINDPKKYAQYLKEVDKVADGASKYIEAGVRELNQADLYTRNAYEQFKERFNEVYQAFEIAGNKDKIKVLEEFQKETASVMQKYTGDPRKVDELADEISKGLRILRSVGGENAPPIWRPAQEAVIDKAATTFGNLAFQSFSKFGETSPIISIENPPAGDHALTRADELKSLVKKAQDNFVRQATSDPKLGLSESEARKQAEKLIGVTWDVGHINTIKRFGFDDNDVVAQSKQIAPYVKHVHLSDNFGTSHTELPMGMGNVPLQGIMESSEQFKKAKKIVETGGWFRNFGNVTPFRETLQAFGSPVYAMKMAPAWNQVGSSFGGYNPGFGRMLPDVHFNTYGAGFSSLPTELGGQLPGNRSRLSGAPLE